MISIPIAVKNALFEWQLDLFWFAHKKIYGNTAREKTIAVVINRDTFEQQNSSSIEEWQIDVPHKMCNSFYDYLFINRHEHFWTPMNIQCGVLQVINEIEDEEIVEILDCDMFHFRAAPEIQIQENEIFVCDLYENWHLKSLTDNKQVIEEYFINQGRYYNGGFVPLIAKAKTFKLILNEWLDLHIDIIEKATDDGIKWWAGMYAFNAVCERNQINMVAKDFCYIPNVNEISDNQYISHYSADPRFNKKTYPNIDENSFLDNIFYEIVKEWLVDYRGRLLCR